MKATLTLCSIAALILPLAARAAEPMTLAENAKRVTSALPAGCIVTAEQTGTGAPAFSIAGKHEPAGVPPDKIIFEIGSISKVFTGLLLAQAVIDKKVKLDSTLREVMGPRQNFADKKVADITMLQLATHTSGLPRLPDNLDHAANGEDPYAHYDRAALDAYLATAKLDHAAPFPFSYSNLGVGLLGDVLARLQGKTWEELVVDQIAKPLGMIDTCVTLNAEQAKRFAPAYADALVVEPWTFAALAGAGALRSTAADMLKFAQALAKPDSTPLKQAIEGIEQPQPGTSMGLCLQVAKAQGQPIYWHNGGTGGFRSLIMIKPISAELRVILINNNDLAPEAVLAGKLPENPTSQPADPALADYVGEYDTGVKARGTTILYRFEARGSELWLQITGQAAIPLERHATVADRFVFEPVKAEIQFTRRSGKVISTTLFQAGLEIKADKLPAKKTK